jgi:hypothetical protein
VSLSDKIHLLHNMLIRTHHSHLSR